MIKFFSAIFILLFASLTFAKTINIIAAENFYGGIAQQIGGSHVKIVSILNNPNQDPHLFSAKASIAKAISTADIIIYNGIGYDTWINQLLQHARQHIIVVANLVGAKDGDNPHLWYKPETAIALAKTVLALLIQDDPANKQDYLQNYNNFDQQYKKYITRIQDMKKRCAGIGIIATEPVFNYLGDALGFVIHGQAFQLSIMNDVPPSPSQIADFEDVLKNHKARLLIYNTQVMDPVTRRMRAMALENHVPAIGVYETEPPETSFLSWMNDTLNLIENALKSESP